MLRRSYLRWRRDYPVESPTFKYTPQVIDIKNGRDPLNDTILTVYDVLEDDLEFRASVLSSKNLGGAFDRYRKNYRARYEFAHYYPRLSSSIAGDFEALGFAKTRSMASEPF